MIGAQPGVIWSYNNSAVVTTFDDSIGLKVSADVCNNVTLCLWYVSPLWQFNDAAKTNYAFLGEWNKWTAVSQQRFTSIVTNPEKTQTTITFEGERHEIVHLAVYHPAVPSGIVDCEIQPGNAEGQILITASGVYCR